MESWWTSSNELDRAIPVATEAANTLENNLLNYARREPGLAISSPSRTSPSLFSQYALIVYYFMD